MNSSLIGSTMTLFQRTTIKTKLLIYLSNQEDFVTSSQITEELGLNNPQQAQLLCRELESDLADCYQDNEFVLVTSQSRGFLLKRQTGDLKLLLNDYRYSELSYHLLTSLFYESPVNTAAFCEKNYVSEATLRRKIRQLNLYLAAFNLRITAARELKLVGEEADILTYYFLSNHLTYQTINNLSMPKERQNRRIREAQKILTDLGQSFTDFQIEMFALLYGSQAYRIEKGITLSCAPTVLNEIPPCFFPEKPKQLEHWSIFDWQFLILTTYTFCLYFPTKSLIDKALKPLYQAELATWQTLFQQFFSPKSDLTFSAQEEELIRLFLFNRLIPKNVYLFQLFPILSMDELIARYPLHIERFQQFSEAFLEIYPQYNTYHFSIHSLLTTLQLAPIEQKKETVSIYLEAIYSKNYQVYLKTKITERLHDKYHLLFVDQVTEADMTISAMKYFNEASRPDYVFIHPLLLESDYRLIEQAITQVLVARKQN